MIERRQTRAALCGAVAAPVRDVRDAAIDFDQRRLIAHRHGETARALELLGRTLEVAGIQIDARQPQHGVQTAHVVVHFVREIQAALEVWQRRLRLTQHAQAVAL